MIQKRLEKLQPYFRGLKVAENYKIVELTLKKSWDVEQTEDIMFNQKETKEGGNTLYTMFYSETKSFDEILDFVEGKVINYNLEVEEKERLLKAKVEELKRVFETKTLDELNQLKFTTEVDSLKLNYNGKGVTQNNGSSITNNINNLELEKVINNGNGQKTEKV